MDISNQRNLSDDNRILFFEKFFVNELHISPRDFILLKVKAGSDFVSIKYAYDIVTAEVGRKNKCCVPPFSFYYDDEMKEFEKNIKEDKGSFTAKREIIQTQKQCEYVVLNKQVKQKQSSEQVEKANIFLQQKSMICRGELLDGNNFLYKYSIQLGALYSDRMFMNAVDALAILNSEDEMSERGRMEQFKYNILIPKMRTDSFMYTNSNLKYIEDDVAKMNVSKDLADISVYYALRLKQILVARNKAEE